MSTDGQRIKRRRNIAENFNRLSRVHERYRQRDRRDDRQTTDGRATACSERSLKSHFVGNTNICSTQHIIHATFHGRPFLSRLSFWATVCKTVRPILSLCLSCLTVCDVRALWPNGWMDQDETWHASRPQLWTHCVRWGPRFPTPKRGGAPLSNSRPISIVAKRLDASRCHLVWR